MNQILQIFIMGIVILLVAIIVNFLANALGILTWYSFFTTISKIGFIETIKTKALHFIFLFMLVVVSSISSR